MSGESGLSAKQVVVDYFLEHPTATNLEISQQTAISKSSVQRYLSAVDVKGIPIPGTGRTIAEQIQFNTKKARQKGGRNTFQKYSAQKNEAGHFVGIAEDSLSEDKEEAKRQDIRNIILYFSKNPYKTIEEIAGDLSSVKIGNAKKVYTRDYVYRCLTDPRVGEMFGEDMAQQILSQLDQNRYGLLRKTNGSLDPSYYDEAGLTEKEKEVLLFRFQDGNILSASEVAEHFGVSKTTILNLEDSAIAKILHYQQAMGQK